MNQSRQSNHNDLWRIYMKEVYNDLIDRWIDGSGRGFGLKTDLYDEAVSSHGLVPLLNLKCESVIGIDVSPDVVMAAKERLDKEWHKNTMWRYLMSDT